MFSLRATTNPSATTKCRCPLHLSRYKLWVMDLELLQAISLAVSQIRTVETVLKMIVAGLVDNAGVALARIWLLGPGDICSTCKMSGECSDRTRCLHLAASAGCSQLDSTDWSRLDGSFQRFPLGVRKIGWIGSTGESMLIEDSVADMVSRHTWSRKTSGRSLTSTDLTRASFPTATYE